MINKRIVHLYELTIPMSDRERMDPKELAFIATLAFAVDEISIFQKLVVQADTLKPEATELRYLHQVQLNSITRVLSAKVYEAIKIFEQYVKRVERGKDDAKKKKLKEFEIELRELTQDDSYNLARIIRDKVTSHYLQTEVEKNLPHVPEKAKFVSYLHKNQGNSVYPFGEECVFLARIGRHYAETSSRTFSIDDIRNWTDWTVRASAWISRSYADYLLWMHHERFPDWRLRPRKPYMEMELFAELGERPLPLIFSSEEYMKRKNKAGEG